MQKQKNKINELTEKICIYNCSSHLNVKIMSNSRERLGHHGQLGYDHANKMSDQIKTK